MANRQGQRLQKKPRPKANPPNGRVRHATDTKLEALLARAQVLVPAPREVRTYLRTHAELAKIVPAVCAKARKEFGLEAELVLKAYRDPEIKNNHLTLYVRLPFYDGSILERMDRVSDQFSERLSIASGFLLITTDLRPPKVENEI